MSANCTDDVHGAHAYLALESSPLQNGYTPRSSGCRRRSSATSCGAGWVASAPVDPNNLIAQAMKWRSGDIGAHAGGDVTAALGAITAQFVVSPFSENLFFPPEDCQAEAAAIPKGEFRPIETPMGHVGVFCLRPEDREAIDGVIAEVLAV